MDKERNHYVPDWAVSKGDFSKIGGKVNLSDDKTGKDLAIWNSSKGLGSKPPCSYRDNCSLEDAQMLLNKSCFYLLSEPRKVVVEQHLSLDMSLFLGGSGILLEGDNQRGWVANSKYWIGGICWWLA